MSESTVATAPPSIDHVIVSWLERFTRRRPSREELLNEGLALAMDWGESWLSPIQSRLRKLHPFLAGDELDAYNAACQGAMRLAHETVHSQLRTGTANPSLAALSSTVRAAYPWVSEENLERLLKQGLYYAAKVGGHGREP